MLIKSRFNDVINSSELVAIDIKQSAWRDSLVEVPDFLIPFRSDNILSIRLTHINQIVHN